jgi:hypothetical protein
MGILFYMQFNIVYAIQHEEEEVFQKFALCNNLYSIGH